MRSREASSIAWYEVIARVGTGVSPKNAKASCAGGCPCRLVTASKFVRTFVEAAFVGCFINHAISRQNHQRSPERFSRASRKRGGPGETARTGNRLIPLARDAARVGGRSRRGGDRGGTLAERVGGKPRRLLRAGEARPAVVPLGGGPRARFMGRPGRCGREVAVRRQAVQRGLRRRQPGARGARHGHVLPPVDAAG